MHNQKIEIKTGPFLFGDVTATRFGAMWHIETKPSLWHRMYFTGLLVCMKTCFPQRQDNDK